MASGQMQSDSAQPDSDTARISDTQNIPERPDIMTPHRPSTEKPMTGLERVSQDRIPQDMISQDRMLSQQRPPRIEFLLDDVASAQQAQPISFHPVTQRTQSPAPDTDRPTPPPVEEQRKVSIAAQVTGESEGPSASADTSVDQPPAEFTPAHAPRSGSF